MRTAWPTRTLVALALLGAAALEARGDCLRTLRIEGEAGAVRRARRILEAGLLPGLADGECEGAVVSFEERAGRWRVRVSRGERAVEHTAASLELATTWVESWLAPVPDEPPAPRPEVAVAQAAPPPPPAAEPETRPAASPPARNDVQARSAPAASGGVPIQLALRVGVDIDDLGPWTGAELALNISLTRAVWLGMAAGAAVAADRDFTDRNVLRLHARGGWRTSLPFGALWLGGGVGLASATAQFEPVEGGDVTRQDEAGPFAEGFGGLDVGLAKHLSVSVAASVRGMLVGAENDPEEPDALESVSTTIQVGLAWDFGGRW